MSLVQSSPRKLAAAIVTSLVVASILLTAVPVAAKTATATLVGAGDISTCSNDNDAATAALVAAIPGTVFTAGDNVYPSGKYSNFVNCYAPTWGQFKNRTRPVIGNHEFVAGAAGKGYFHYFRRKAGPSGRGYYKYDLAGWRIYALSSECAPADPCSTAQYNWLKADLEANPRQCVLAIWHRPVFSTGPHGNSTRMASIFQLLYDHGADVVINGHDHLYERYTPIDPTDTPDPVNGIREFVVGTGGAEQYHFKTDDPSIEVRAEELYGVLRLDLSSDGTYSWQFIPTTTDGFTDSGTASCH